MTDEERREAERLISERLKRALDAGSGFTFEEEKLITMYYVEGYAAACDGPLSMDDKNKMLSRLESWGFHVSQRDQYKEMKLERELEFERARSAKLRVELQHIIDHEWTASPTSSSAWKWINHFVDGARKALAENEVARD